MLQLGPAVTPTSSATPDETASGPEHERLAIVLDTDIGSDIDDAVCLSYLLAQPRCDLLGITTVSGRPRLRAALADAICRAAGADVPIHAGTEAALLGPTPQPDVPQASVLDRFEHRSPDDIPPNTAVTFLRDTILSAPGPVTLLAIGPMTNVALLFATYPEVAEQLEALVMMCGVFSNRTPRVGPYEWNAWCDADAAEIVYRTPVRQHISVGLDVTRRCATPATEAIERFETIGGPLAVVAAMTEVWAQRVPDVTFHDPLAAVSIFCPEVCTWAGGRVSVELQSQRFRGVTSFDRDRDGSPHRVATDVDAPFFFAELFDVCATPSRN